MYYSVAPWCGRQRGPGTTGKAGEVRLADRVVAIAAVRQAPERYTLLFERSPQRGRGHAGDLRGAQARQASLLSRSRTCSVVAWPRARHCWPRYARNEHY